MIFNFKMIKNISIIFFINFFLTISLNANAEWINTAYSDKGDYYHYDPLSLSRHNDYIVVWELVDYTRQSLTPDKPIYSAKNLIQIDCLTLKHRFISSIYFSQTGGAGYIVMNDDSISNWTPNYSGSTGYAHATAICRNY